MSERKGLSPKVRFEVFKRDSFKCQYCGKASPDVLLEVDHIKPVKEGGDNDITNLVTSCKECNIGKGARLLTDNSVLQKQRKQLEELNERRHQLEMMMEWRSGLRDIDDSVFDTACDYYENATGYSLTQSGEKTFRKTIKKYGLSTVLDVIDIAVEQYAVYDGDEYITEQSIGKVFDMIDKVCNMKVVEKEKPYIKELLYIRGIVRNRMYCNDPVALKLLERAHLAGASIQGLKDVALTVRNWTCFLDELTDFIDKKEGE